MVISGEMLVRLTDRRYDQTDVVNPKEETKHCCMKITVNYTYRDLTLNYYYIKFKNNIESNSYLSLTYLHDCDIKCQLIAQNNITISDRSINSSWIT